jgi:hypothetical protein
MSRLSLWWSAVKNEQKVIVVFQATMCYLSIERNQASGCYIWGTTIVALREARLLDVMFEGTTVLALRKSRLLAVIFGSTTTLALRETKLLDFQLRFSHYVPKTPIIFYFWVNLSIEFDG